MNILLLSAIIAILLAIIIIIISIRTGKPFFKSLMIIYFLLLIGLLIFGSAVVKDALSFKEGFESNPSLFLLLDQEKIISAFILKPALKDSFVPLSSEQFESYKSSFAEGKINYISKDYFKLFIVDSSIFNETELVDVGTVNISAGELLAILRSDDPKDALTERIAQFKGLDKSLIKLDWDVRGTLFRTVFSDATSNIDLAVLVGYFKSEQISLYPESLMFKVLKFVPDSLINPALKEVEE